LTLDQVRYSAKGRDTAPSPLTARQPSQLQSGDGLHNDRGNGPIPVPVESHAKMAVVMQVLRNKSVLRDPKNKVFEEKKLLNYFLFDF
jgi:hypothetical protein